MTRTGVEERVDRTTTGPWTCLACTFREERADAVVCSVCATARPAEGDWLCEACTLVNRGSAEACEVCEAPAKGRKRKRPSDDEGIEASVVHQPRVNQPSTESLRPPTTAQIRREQPGTTPRRDSLASSSPGLTAQQWPPGNFKRPQAWRELPVCGVGDRETCAQLLEEHGVVVFRGVVEPSEVEVARDLFWNWLERHTSARRTYPSTHTRDVFRTIGYPNTGVVTKHSIGQSRFLWHCRLACRRAWETVWGDGDLVTSFDGCGVWPNPYGPGAHFTDGRWYHLDQNVREHPGFLGYQGLVQIGAKATATSGSLVVVPGSHRDFRQNCERGDKALDRGSFVRLDRPADRQYCDARAVQVAPLEPGDVVVWDSRIVHCSAGVCKNLPPNHSLRRPVLPDHRPPALARLVAYVAMQPRSRVSAQVAEQRETNVRRGLGSGWNGLIMRRTPPAARDYSPPPPQDPAWSLV